MSVVHRDPGPLTSGLGARPTEAGSVQLHMDTTTPRMATQLTAPTLVS